MGGETPGIRSALDVRPVSPPKFYLKSKVLFLFAYYLKMKRDTGTDLMKHLEKYEE
jgi:hypothetical protein